MLRIFVSSVSSGMKDIRRQIIDDLKTAEYDILAMESFGARSDVPLDVCLRELRTAEAVVVIVGPRYGSLIPSDEISYTHREFHEAMRCGIPVLAFKLPISEDLEDDERERLQRFVDEVQSALTYKEATPETLSGIVQASITGARHRGELGRRYSLFQSWKNYFSRQLSTDSAKPSLFNHLTQFIGRTKELQRITDFAHNDYPVLTLVAPGGIGKSRLLLEAARQLEESPEVPKVLFVDTAADWTSDDITQLPSIPTILVIDDAHRRPDLDRLIAACLHQNNQIRFVVSCRPSAIDIVRPHLATIATEGMEEAEIRLDPLWIRDARALASDCLTEEFEHLADRLINIADNNPLVISVGAKCISSKQVPPEILDHTPEEFRTSVLDALLRDPSFQTNDARNRHRLLELIATIGPVDAEDATLAERIAEFIGVPLHDFRRMIADLEVSGFIQRRGRLLRVTPDILADHLLYRAGVASGSPTGYVESVVEKFSPDMLGNILANAAELDWRATATATHEPVLTTTWTTLLKALPDATNRQRADVLSHVRRAAIFAPSDVLKIVEWICQHPEGPKDELLETYGLEDNPEQTIDACSDLLGLIATHPDYTTRCMSSLWNLAIEDERPTNPTPAHPRRQIYNLLQYDGQVPPRVQQQAFTFINERLMSEDARPDVPWAVNALGALLARQGETKTASRREITIGTFPLAPYFDQIATQRSNALDCLLRIGVSSVPTEAHAAINELGKLLRQPIGLLGREVDEEEVATWLPEAKRAAGLLQTIASDVPTDLIRYLARRQIRDVARGYWPDLDPSLDAALDDSPAVAAEGLFDILVGMPWAEELDDWEAERKRVHAACTNAAHDFWERHGTPERVASALLDAISVIDKVIQTDPHNKWLLVRALVMENPDRSEELIDALVKSGLESGLALVQPALTGLRDLERHDNLLSLIKEYATSSSELLRLYVAQTLRLMITGEHGLLQSYLDVISQSLKDESQAVRRAAMFSLVSLRDIDPSEAMEMLMSVDWTDDLKLVETACTVLNPSVGIDPALLNDEQIDRVLGRIQRVRALESNSHNILQFLAYASERRPHATVEMLLNRIKTVDDHIGERGEKRWIPIPHNARGLSLSGLMHVSEYPNILRRIRDASLDASAHVNLWISELFHAATSDLLSCIEVLREWTRSQDADKIVATAQLLRSFDHSTVFTQHRFVAELLEAASHVSDDCLQRTKAKVFGLAISGVYSGRPGQPAPRHVSDKAEASQLVEQYTDRPAVRDFYQELVHHAEGSIKRELLDWESEEDDE